MDRELRLELQNRAVIMVIMYVDKVHRRVLCLTRYHHIVQRFTKRLVSGCENFLPALA